MKIELEDHEWHRIEHAVYTEVNGIMGQGLDAEETLRDAIRGVVAVRCAEAWDNGVDTAGQYAEQPWVVDDECKPLNPYREEA